MAAEGTHGTLLSLLQLDVLMQADAHLVRLQHELAEIEAEARRRRGHVKALRAAGQDTRVQVDALVDVHIRLKAAHQRLVQHQQYFQQIVNSIHADQSCVAQQPGYEARWLLSKLLAPGKQE